jgi:hypothetical protein
LCRNLCKPPSFVLLIPLPPSCSASFPGDRPPASRPPPSVRNLFPLRPRHMTTASLTSLNTSITPTTRYVILQRLSLTACQSLQPATSFQKNRSHSLQALQTPPAMRFHPPAAPVPPPCFLRNSGAPMPTGCRRRSHEHGTHCGHFAATGSLRRAVQTRQQWGSPRRAWPDGRKDHRRWARQAGTASRARQDRQGHTSRRLFCWLAPPAIRDSLRSGGQARRGRLVRRVSGFSGGMGRVSLVRLQGCDGRKRRSRSILPVTSVRRPELTILILFIIVIVILSLASPPRGCAANNRGGTVKLWTRDYD